MLSENIHWVHFTSNLSEHNHACCDGFANAMEQEHSVMVVELGINIGGTIYQSSVITKHVTLLSQQDSHVLQGES